MGRRDSGDKSDRAVKKRLVLFGETVVPSARNAQGLSINAVVRSEARVSKGSKKYVL